VAHDTKNRFKTRASALAVASCLAVAPLVADAAGLGRLTVLSMLGQPLQAEIELTATREELSGMTAKVASPDAFKLAGIEYGSTLTALRFSIEKRDNGQPYIRLVSERPVSEPFVDMLVELSWPAGRLVREYTFLLDPPEMQPAGEPLAAPVEVPQRATVAPPVSVPPSAPVAAAPLATSAARPIEPSYGAGPGQIDIQRGDTLSKLANQHRGEGVSLEQMLVAMFRENPGAFMGKNMNRMMAGKILNVPSREAAAAISKEDAVREVRAQSADWNAYRRRLAGVVDAAPAAEAVAKQEVSGKIEATVEEKTVAAAPGQDKLRIAKTETVDTGKPVAGAPKEEDKIAQQRALRESAERTAMLEKNVADLQKLVEVKNQGMAEAQKQAEAAKAPAVEPAPATAAPAEAAKPVAGQPAVAKAEAPAEAAAKPVPAPKPRPKVPPPPPEPEPSFIEDLAGNPAIWGGLLAAIGGGVGLLLYRRRKASGAGTGASAVTGTLSQPSLGANSVFRATGGQAVDTSNVTPATTDFSQAGPGTIDTDEVDPVAEAEVYMAYGRDAQAEEILLEALQKDPKRTAIHGKLLEIYANRKSVKQFETLATELYAQTGGEGAEWEAAAALGAQLDPSNSLYTGPGAPPPAVLADAEQRTVRTTSTVTMPGALSQIADAAQSARAEDSANVDLDLGTAAAPAAEGDKQIFDFDLGLGGERPADTPAMPVAKPAGGKDSAGGGLDFDFQFGDQAVETPVDIELTSSLIAPQPLEAESPVDLSRINLDLGAPPPAADDSGDFERTMLFTPGSIPGPAAAGQSVVSDGFDSNVQAVATKLDLAKAYQEMGDAEGARELLDEVLAEGNEAQKAAAREIVSRLG
jgi:pilus assembly protein FimV